VATYGSLRRVRARFGPYQVELNSNELFRAGTRVSIQEQPFQVLRLLLEAEGNVVRREQLRAALWPEDTFVDFEHGVNTAVKKLRQALEDSAEDPKFVETLPKVGYRFIAPVEWFGDSLAKSQPVRLLSIASANQKVDTPTGRHRWQLALAISLVSAALIGFVAVAVHENLFWAQTGVGRWLRQAKTGPVPALTPTQRRLTANPNDTPLTSAVISPDGKYIAYTDATGFYLRLVDSGEVHSVPLPNGFVPLVESWFPDSIHIVGTWYSSDAAPNLWKVSVLGGTPRKIADRGSYARVSPDGSQIAFLKGIWDQQEIWVMEADGSNPRKVVEGEHDSFGPPAWATDGKRLAYVRTTNYFGPLTPGKQLEIYSLDTAKTDVILQEARLGDELAWIKPNRIIYSLQESQNDGQGSNLWWAGVDVSPPRLVGTPVRITNDQTDVTNFSITADGKRIALRRSTFQADVYVSEVARRGGVLSAPRRFTLDERQDWPMAWTRDSKAVLFISDRDGKPHIYKQDLSNSQPELLVEDKNLFGGPRLTPDGASVLYSVSTKPDDPLAHLRVMRMPIAGGSSQSVLEGSGINNFECATLPATLCVYGQRDPTSEYYRFFTFNPDGTKGDEILAGKVKREDGPNHWGLSLDGRYLVTALSQNPYNAPVLRVFDLARGTEQLIPVPQIGLMFGMDWAWDSNTLWLGGFVGRGEWGARSGLFRVDLTGKITPMYRGLNPSITFAIPSPDGRHLALGAATETSNMWLLEDI